MDYKYEYLNELKKLIRPLNEDIQNKIYQDLIKLEDWFLPDLDELKLYFNELDFYIDELLWKFIYRELTFRHHTSIRNELVIKMLKFIKNNNLKIKPFVLTYADTLPDWKYEEIYFLRELEIKKRKKIDYFHLIYDINKMEMLFRYI